MPSAARKGDTGAGHGCFPSSSAIAGSGDVIINGQAAVRLGDAYAAHGCDKCPPHGRSAAQGSSTVNINGKPAVRVGDGISCGGSAAAGSPNVFIGDSTWTGLPYEPEQATLRLFVSQTPGMAGHPYTDEPYKLYHNGGVVQEGKTDAEGMIEYEYDPEPPLSGELKVECSFIEMVITIAALPPVETGSGVDKRLDALGYFASDGQGEPITTGDGQPQYQYFQGDQGEVVTGEQDDSLTQTLKPLMP